MGSSPGVATLLISRKGIICFCPVEAGVQNNARTFQAVCVASAGFRSEARGVLLGEQQMTAVETRHQNFMKVSQRLQHLSAENSRRPRQGPGGRGEATVQTQTQRAPTGPGPGEDPQKHSQTSRGKTLSCVSPLEYEDFISKITVLLCENT